MRNPIVRFPVLMFFRCVFKVILALTGVISLPAQTSNRIWWVMYNGQPTPSSDVSVQNAITSGSGAAVMTGVTGSFVFQTNFPAFNSPYDLVVDPAMGKAYVLDNNLQGETPEYIYSFNIAGTPAQVAASAQIIYTMPVPAADVSANLYPLVSGLALDSLNHYLYFNQIDVTTATNSLLGRLDLATSSNSDLYVAGNNSPTLHLYYTGRIPGQGAIALDTTNVYLGAISRTGNSGVYAAPLDGSGNFTELAGVSTNDLQFTNGLISGVASDPADGLIYYLTYNAGYLNFNFKIAQNAVWAYNTATHTSQKISSGYAGYPDNLSVDSANGRYYFTLGRNGTGAVPATNAQAIYTGVLNTTNAPTLFYVPSLTGQDVNGQPNAGAVVLQGIFVQDAPSLNWFANTANYAPLASPLVLASALTVNDPSSTLLTGATVTITGGGFAGDGDVLAAATNDTAIAAVYNNLAETLALSGADSVFNYAKVLSSVTYFSTNSNPTKSGANTVRLLAWTVTDGVLSSVPAASTIIIQPSTAPALNQVVIRDSANKFTLYYTGNPGQRYVVQFATAVKGPWTDISSVLTASSGGLIEYQDTAIPALTARFYRVRPAN